MIECKSVFWDTAPFVYLLDVETDYTEVMENNFKITILHKAKIFTSVITVAEYLVYPYRQKDYEKINNFFLFLNNANINVIGVNLEIAKQAANFRSKYVSFKGMDSLQLATAYSNKADVFLTNDRQLCRCSELNCVMVEDFGQMIAKQDRR